MLLSKIVKSFFNPSWHCFCQRFKAIVQTPEIPYAKKELERGGWPAPIAEAYAENGGTPHLDRRHTVFGQLVDEDSYKVLDEIANVEVGAQDKPLEDVVIETVEVAD